MTYIFDENARNNMRMQSQFFEYDGLPSNVKAINLKVSAGDVKRARQYIASYHYSKTMPDSTMEVFFGYYGDVFAGVCVFGMGASINQYKSIIPNINKGEYRELTRLWSPDGMPKNTESKLISESIKLLPKNVKLLISFADPSKGHFGTIYQATNWDYCGMTGASKRLVGEYGNEFHYRLLNVYRMRHPELKNKTPEEIMNLYKWGVLHNSSKHRYVKVLGTKNEVKKMKELYKDKIMKYPKMDDK